MTFASRETFHETMKVVETRLNDKGKNWRHVLKSLVLLDYLLHEGSAGVLIWCRRNSYLVRTLCEFQYVDDTAEDAGHYGKSDILRQLSPMALVLISSDSPQLCQKHHEPHQ